MADVPKGFYLSADAENPHFGDVWCWECGSAMAFHLRKRRGVRGCHLAEATFGESDHLEYCQHCDRLVDAGELSEEGLKYEFEYYTESPPTGPSTAHAQVLTIMRGSIWHDDPRYEQVEAWLAIATPAPEVPGA